MAVYKSKPTLDNEEKRYLEEQYKSFLKKNNLYPIRGLSDKSSWRELHIRNFLLYVLGEQLYFNNSNKIYDSEFENSVVSSIEIPESIDSIEDWAFSECSQLESVKINNRTKITINTSSFDETDCTILIPKDCDVCILETTKQYFADNLCLYSDFILEKDPNKQRDMLCKSLDITDTFDRDVILGYVKGVDDRIISKIKFY